MKKKIVIIISVILVINIILFIVFRNINKENNKTKNNINQIKQLLPAMPNPINKDKKDNVVIKDNNKINTSDKIKERHYFIEKVVPNKNIYVEDIQIYGDIKKQKSFFKAKITNNDKDYENLTIFIDFLNKKGEVFISELYVIDSIKKGESKVIEVNDIEDFSNAYDVKILY